MFCVWFLSCGKISNKGTKQNIARSSGSADDKGGAALASKLQKEIATLKDEQSSNAERVAEEAAATTQRIDELTESLREAKKETQEKELEWARKQLEWAKKEASLSAEAREQ